MYFLQQTTLKSPLNGLVTLLVFLKLTFVILTSDGGFHWCSSPGFHCPLSPLLFLGFHWFTLGLLGLLNCCLFPGLRLFCFRLSSSSSGCQCPLSPLGFHCPLSYLSGFHCPLSKLPLLLSQLLFSFSCFRRVPIGLLNIQKKIGRCVKCFEYCLVILFCI